MSQFVKSITTKNGRITALTGGNPSLATDVAGTLPIANGGTGQITAAAAFDALSIHAADVASAATTNIGAAAGRYVKITGTTTITAFDTVADGLVREVEFTGILTLTYNATTLILPTAASITTAAGDTAIFVSEGGGNWRCLVYQRANGQALATSAGTGTSARAVATVDLTTTAVEQDVAGATLTLAAGTWLIAGVFDVTRNGATNDRVFKGALTIAGTDLTDYVMYSEPAAVVGERSSVTSIWRITFAASTICKLRALYTGGTAGDFTVTAANTSITAWTAGAAANTLLDGANHTDTVNNTVVLGDLIAGNSTPKWARVPGQITNTLNVLTQTGTGAVSAVPVWSSLAGLGLASWVKVTVPYNHASLNVAAAAAAVSIYTLAAKAFIHAIVIKPSISFTSSAPAMTSVHTSLGITGPTYSDVLADPFTSWMQAVSDSLYMPGASFVSSLLFSGGTLYSYWQADGGPFLNTLTAGSLDYWLYISTLP